MVSCTGDPGWFPWFRFENLNSRDRMMVGRDRDGSLRVVSLSKRVDASGMVRTGLRRGGLRRVRWSSGAFTAIWSPFMNEDQITEQFAVTTSWSKNKAIPLP